MSNTYRKYFDIDPDFFPAVNIDVIKKEPELWKKFYPHETFKGLLSTVVSVLERQQKLNIWVEGAYGTGKSHAVLTLKRLLDASQSETEDYFKQFGLDEDLLKKLNAVKNNGRVITVHRYGSSSIHSDNDLFLAIQESIEAALKEAGIENAGPGALKSGIIKYLSDSENKQSFEIYVNGSYQDLFGGESIDDIINHLADYKDNALQTLMNKIFKVANERNIKAFTLDSDIMCRWISEVIKANNIKSIVFIWDEFTEYFSNNAHRLTGFQQILDLSQTEPFCFIPVTHRSDAGMDDADSDKKKILGRFVKPTCIIELPENMAFQLMGAAMQKKEDPVLKAEWNNDILPDLEERTHDSRKRIKEFANIDDAQLRGILPIHPYAACLLKHISASFASNQRSMFDFIKNGGNKEQKGFQWFMDAYGPFGENPFLTIDLLWGFFYENGKNDLSLNIRQTLDRYAGISKNLDDEEQRVLKTILLLQAMSISAGDSVELFLPNEKNLNFAFEGTDFESGQAINCAEKLVRDKVIYKKNLKDGSTQYSILTGEMDSDQIEKKKAEFVDKTTATLIKEGSINEAIELPHDLNLRFKRTYVGQTDFDVESRKAEDNSTNNPRYFEMLVCVSKDDAEANALSKKIENIFVNNANSELIFVDCSKSSLGKEKFESWVEYMATSSYYAGKDNTQSNTYLTYAKSVLSEWRQNIQKGQYVLYTKTYPKGTNINDIDTLISELKNIDSKKYALSLECNFKSVNHWWLVNSLQVGVECGINRVLKGIYNNNNANLKNLLGKCWEEDNYWESYPAEKISRIKSKLEEFIQGELKNNGRIAISDIYDYLKQEPYGWLPCNMTAFFMGFLLKEYVSDKYTWSDSISSDALTIDKMKEMIEEIIKLDQTPNDRYRQKYIVTMTPEEKAFIEGTSQCFDIDRVYCSSIESARDRIRTKLKENFSFPIWTLQGILKDENIKSSIDLVKGVIDDYQSLVNNTSSQSDTDVAASIGKKFLFDGQVIIDLKNLLNEEKCKKGMLVYLENYKQGEIISLGKAINDNGQYINELKKKIDAAEANWVWKQETVDKQIDAVILEYKIIECTNKIIGTCSKFSDAIKLWCEKCDNIRISCETAKHHVSDIVPLLTLLKEIKGQGYVQETKKQEFYDNIINYGQSFNDFYANQLDVFRQACKFYIGDLESGDQEKIFKKLSGPLFVLDNASYSKKVEEATAEYKKELGSVKLRKIWKDNTGTDSPYAWSNNYKMPIQLMIEDDDLQECRMVFDLFNGTVHQDKDIAKGLKYLESFKYWAMLNDSSERDKAFKEKMLGDNAVVISDIDEIKDYLSSHLSEDPFYWMGNNMVRKTIEGYAEHQYNTTGLELAMKKIDTMDSDSAKAYLKDLIKNNKNVGIQIIKGN